MDTQKQLNVPLHGVAGVLALLGLAERDRVGKGLALDAEERLQLLLQRGLFRPRGRLFRPERLVFFRVPRGPVGLGHLGDEVRRGGVLGLLGDYLQQAAALQELRLLALALVVVGPTSRRSARRRLLRAGLLIRVPPVRASGVTFCRKIDFVVENFH